MPMKPTILTALLAIIYLSAFPQADLQINISTRRIARDVFILASDSLEGRKFPSAGRAKAAAYIAGQFLEAGLQPIEKNHEPYFQKIPVNHTRIGLTYIHLDGKLKRSGFDFSFASSMPYNNSLTLPIRFIGDEKLNMKIGGGDTIFYIVDKNIEQAMLRIEQLSKTTQAEYFAISITKSKKSTKSLIVQEYLSGQYRYPESLFKIKQHTKGLYSYPAYSEQNLKVFLFTDEITQSLYGQSLKQLQVNAKRSVKSAQQRNLTVSDLTFSSDFWVKDTVLHDDNVIGYIPGTDLSDEVVIVCGHYDHLGKSSQGIYYGADDNASGSAGVMELARMCSQARANGFDFRRTLVFIAFGAEESGLNGSYYYVSNPVFPLKQTVMVLNMDMIGRSDNKPGEPGTAYSMAIGSRSRTMKKSIRQLNRQMDNIHFDYSVNFPNSITWYFGSDHYPFVRKKVPALVFNTGLHDDYHKVTDKPEKINYESLTNILKGMFVLLVDLANEPEKYPLK